MCVNSIAPEVNRFWMVYAEGAGRPTMKHDNRESAEKEAQRIAQKDGRITFVLEAVSGFAMPVIYPSRIKITSSIGIAQPTPGPCTYERPF